jgi:hypothetical protein
MSQPIATRTNRQATPVTPGPSWKAPAVLAAGPTLFAIATVVLAEPASGGPTDGALGFIVLVVLKLAAVASLVVLAGRLGRAIAGNRRRIAATGTAWAGAALGLLGLVVANIEPFLAYGCRVWPGGDHLAEDVAAYETSRYTTTTIVAYEAVAMVAIAFAAAAAAGWFGNRSTVASGASACVTAFVGLLAYDLLAPWSFVVDYDFFQGDAVLGGVQGELIFLVVPWGDPAGAIALGVAGLSTAALLAFWTRTTAP